MHRFRKWKAIYVNTYTLVVTLTVEMFVLCLVNVAYALKNLLCLILGS